MNTIAWNTNYSMTVDAALTEDKGVLLDFYNPDSIVCRQMEKDTYSNEKVISIISEHLMPFRVNFDQVSYFQDYFITWTPSVIFLDKLGRENHRSVGYLGPQEFIATALLAMGKIYSNNSNFAGAQYHFDKVMKEYAQSQFAEEAMYFSGINSYRQTNNAGELKTAAELLHKEYPASIWAKKSEPYLHVMESQKI
jgi:thioredoxin-related protein